MSRIYVAGLINIETTLAVDGFPLMNVPCRYPLVGLETTVSGVSYNVAKALTDFEDQIEFAMLIGRYDDYNRNGIKAAEFLTRTELDEWARRTAEQKE